jgi:hypothetical protein
VGPEILALVQKEILNLEHRFPFQQVRKTDRGAHLTKPGRQDPAKGDALLTTRIPHTGRKAINKNQEIGGSAIELRPDNELFAFKNLLCPVAGQMDFEAARQERIACHTRFYRLDVVFIEARETGDAFVTVPIKVGPGRMDAHFDL